MKLTKFVKLFDDVWLNDMTEDNLDLVDTIFQFKYDAGKEAADYSLDLESIDKLLETYIVVLNDAELNDAIELATLDDYDQAMELLASDKWQADWFVGHKELVKEID